MRPAHLIVSLAAAVILAACKKEEIASYRVPKEQAPPPARMPNDHNHAGVAKSAGSSGATQAAPSAPTADGNATANTPVATAGGNALTWKGPAHWQEKPASGMRKGTFTIPGEGGAAELAITAFPGDVGGEAANVNRWRGQLGLQPLPPDEAVRSIERLDANGVKIGAVEMVGTGASAKRVLAAMVSHGGSTWFFKLEGPDALVAKEKAAFRDFVKTIGPAK